MPTAEQHRTALSPPRRDEAHRAIVVGSIIMTWPDRRRVATKCKVFAETALAEMASAEIQRSCVFCEHRSPPLPRFAVGCERMAAT
jgi:hypothetical protein